MDIAKLALIGSQMAEIGMELAKARQARDEAQVRINELEQELRPLLAEHTQILAALVTPQQAPAPVYQQMPSQPPVPGAYPQQQQYAQYQPPPQYSPPVATPATSAYASLPPSQVSLNVPPAPNHAAQQAAQREAQIKEQIKEFLRTANPEDYEKGQIGPEDVANALRIDPYLVRSIMGRMARGEN